MSIRVAISHETTYRYDRPTGHAPHVVRLRPAPHTRAKVQSYSLKIDPGGHYINWQQDPFGNYQARLVFPDRIGHLKIVTDLVLDLDVINPFDFFVEPSADKFPFEYDSILRKELLPYFEVTEAGPRLNEWVASVSREPVNTVDFLVDLNARLQREISYSVRMEPGIQTCEETLSSRRGSCRDSGWLLVQILRHLGLAARFVSGYLVQLRPDEKPIEGPAGTAQDFTDLHAWTEVYVPGAGWIGLDATSGLLAGEGHIPLACTPDPASAAPITGSTETCHVEFEHANSVQRLSDPPRPSKPYSTEEWQAISTLAEQVDQDLVARDVRLTQGGEPTFVGIDNRDASEWNIAALGPHKRERAYELLLRLRDHLSPKGLLHFGQGKWYPGEELPRWKFACYWRIDGEPIWQDPSLVAEESRPTGAGLPEAERFAKRLAQRLAVSPDHVIPGLEDAVYYLWKEGTLPINVDPMSANTKDPLERQRLRRLLERGLDQSTGFALPLGWDGTKWFSHAWEFRRGRMYLIPGDSPMGYRLPLDSLPFAAPSDLPIQASPDNFDFPSPLGDIHGRVDRRLQQPIHPVGTAETDPLSSKTPTRGRAVAGNGRSTSSAPSLWLSPGALTRTALCVEPRQGNIHIFMPPLKTLEAYLDLVATIEATANDLQLPVLIEGYEPPEDVRIENISMSPDPGVLEVNTPPSSRWGQLVDLTETVYELARQSRLTTTKFLIDGRHVGTGGGNHFVLGGACPADSPFLRRPDLMQSLLAFWQNHPSLSYLFSGLFIGPTSQSPRVDEARDENVYELETAFRQLDWHMSANPSYQAPWLVDRVLRNHLADLTGNTHRSEFCIDKLFSPDSFSGRRGLVEMRGFEMPPAARMSLLQQLLIRAMTSQFWKTPYRQPMVRWGTELHDRFMLPHYLWEDFKDVLLELQQAGYGFDREWFLPHFEFRFPVYGTIQIDDLQVELRMAMEPWNVLGEETSAGGTSRAVDSSTERLQVKVIGMTDPRHVLTVNGRRIPLRPTATRGNFVGGVRFRAWELPSSLHPTVPIHTPLVFDVHDTWTHRSVGGCTYHVYHPGGRAHETMPVNEYEAEGRRLSRFWAFGHTPGVSTISVDENHGDMPWTLDLLRPPGRPTSRLV
ncbi:transglutaminase family protein [bacterium]|nr:transglutaminase family protein [bacterium]